MGLTGMRASRTKAFSAAALLAAMALLIILPHAALGLPPPPPASPTGPAASGGSSSSGSPSQASPAVVADLPAENATVTTTPIVFAIDVIDPSLATCSLVIDGIAMGSFLIGSPGTYTQQADGLAPGTHLWLVACQGNGAAAETETRSFDLEPGVAPAALPGKAGRRGGGRARRDRRGWRGRRGRRPGRRGLWRRAGNGGIPGR